ncbi:hypothetical protein J8871_03020, partial [Bacteroides nordii]|uniref:hypothetical protein n=1 Tax=Bacteroides nordii TaxID=291645 RepID=UPI001F371F1E
KPFFGGGCLKIQKRQLTRNELVALIFIILGISLFIQENEYDNKGLQEYTLFYNKNVHSYVSRMYIFAIQKCTFF